MYTAFSTNLATDAFSFQLLGGFQAQTHRQAVSHQRDVGSPPLHLRLADLHREVGRHALVRHFERLSVQQLVLEKHHWKCIVKIAQIKKQDLCFNKFNFKVI